MLYAALIGPVEALINDKAILLVAFRRADGLAHPLLVTEKPALGIPPVRPRPLAYRDAAWLLKRHAVSVLPAVVSLKALRVCAQGAGEEPADRLWRPGIQCRGSEPAR